MYLTKGDYIEIDTNAFGSPQTYFADLAVKTTGGYVALTSIQIEMTKAPNHINLPPNFAAPLENISVYAFDSSAWQYISPFAYDPESNPITFDVDTSARVPSCGKLCFVPLGSSAFFTLVIQRGLLREIDSGVYPIKVTLTDSVTKLKTVNRFNITLIVPNKSQRVPSTVTEVYKAFEGAPTAPDFFSLRKASGGINAYNVYTTALSGGLDSSAMSYSTFPSGSGGSSTPTNATAVTLATFPLYSA